MTNEEIEKLVKTYLEKQAYKDYYDYRNNNDNEPCWAEDLFNNYFFGYCLKHTDKEINELDRDNLKYKFTIEFKSKEEEFNEDYWGGKINE